MSYPLSPLSTITALILSLLTSSAIADSKIVVIPLGGDSAPASFSEFANNPQDQTLPSGSKIVLSLNLKAPANGKVIVNSSAIAYAFSSVNTISVQCSLSTGSSIELTRSIKWRRKSSSDSRYGLISLTRGFNVTKGTNYRFSLICNSSINNSAGIYNIDLAAVFNPNSLAHSWGTATLDPSLENGPFTFRQKYFDNQLLKYHAPALIEITPAQCS